MTPLMAALLGLLPAAVSAPPPMPDVRPLLQAALRAPDGRAQGRLTGELAEAITRRFQASGPIHVKVTTLHRYVQPGCARLNVRFWQDGVVLPEAPAARRQTVDVGIDYCQDGLPPRSKERRP